MAKTEVTGAQIKDASVSLTADVTGILPVANGGSGSNSLTLNNVLLGNGTGAVQVVAPSTAGKVLRSDGTTWASANVGVGDISASTSAALGVGSIELGHASDTTLSRSSAGVLAVEGVTVPVNSTTNTHTAQQIELGHASDTTLSRSSAGVLAVEGVTVPLNSTTNTHTAQQIELGHASDTTLSRSSAGVLAVEGVTVPLNSITNTHTAQQIELGHASDTTLTRSAAGKLAVEGTDVLLNGGALGTPSSGTLTNCSGLPTSALVLNGAGSAYVSTSETTTSTTYTDLTTTTDTVTVTIGASQLAMVLISARASNGTAGSGADMGFDVSGANTVSAGTNGTYIRFPSTGATLYGAGFLLTGLSSGSTTFKAKYRVQGSGTATFADRRIQVIPL